MSKFFVVISFITIVMGAMGNDFQVINSGILWAIMSVLTDIKDKL